MNSSEGVALNLLYTVQEKPYGLFDTSFSNFKIKYKERTPKCEKILSRKPGKSL